VLIVATMFAMEPVCNATWAAYALCSEQNKQESYCFAIKESIRSSRMYLQVKKTSKELNLNAVSSELHSFDSSDCIRI
jgi:hypothetical protein